MHLLRRLIHEPRMAMLGAFALIAITNYALGLILGRLLTPGNYGLIAFGQTVGLIANLVLTLGLPPSLTAVVVKVDEAGRAALIRGALLVNLVVGAVIGVAILALFMLGPLRPGLETMTVAAVVVAGVPFMAISAIAQGSLQGIDRFGLSAGINALEVLAKAFVGIALVILGLGAVGALAGITVSFILGALLSFYYFARVLYVGPRGAIHLPETHVALPLFGAQIGLVILLNLDLLSVKVFAPDGRVLTGYYQAATILANAPYYLAGSALVPVLFTRVARARGIWESRHAVAEVLSLCALLVLPFETPLVLFPKLALRIFFPSAYAPGADALRLLAIGNTALIPVAILGAAFQAAGRPKVPAAILLSVTVGEAIALAMVVPRWQIIGSSTIFLIAASLCFGALAMTYVQILGLTVMRSFVAWLVRYAIAICLAVATGFAAWVSTVNPIVTLCIAGLTYLPAVLALGLIGQDVLAVLRRKPLPSSRPVQSDEDPYHTS